MKGVGFYNGRTKTLDSARERGTHLRCLMRDCVRSCTRSSLVERIDILCTLILSPPGLSLAWSITTRRVSRRSG